MLLRGKDYVYPLEMLQVLTGVNPLLVGADRFRLRRSATIKSTLSPPQTEDSFEEWGVRNLGRTLYDLCFGIYSARVWGLPTSQISSKQAQRVAKLNLKNVILRTLGIKADPATYFTKYMYPRRGSACCSRTWPPKCGRRATVSARCAGREAGARRRSDRARRLRAERREETIECDGVISTLPLPALVE